MLLTFGVRLHSPHFSTYSTLSELKATLARLEALLDLSEEHLETNGVNGDEESGGSEHGEGTTHETQ